jgi:hypothetical protein
MGAARTIADLDAQDVRKPHADAAAGYRLRLSKEL